MNKHAASYAAAYAAYAASYAAACSARDVAVQTARDAYDAAAAAYTYAADVQDVECPAGAARTAYESFVSSRNASSGTSGSP
jgi:hypothetical protein